MTIKIKLKNEKLYISGFPGISRSNKGNNLFILKSPEELQTLITELKTAMELFLKENK